MNKFLAFLFLLAVLILPFFKGLFFEETQLQAQVALLTLSLVSIVFYGLYRPLPPIPFKLLALAAAFPLYLHLAAFQGISRHASSVGNLQYLTYFSFFISGLLLIRGRKALTSLQITILLTGALITLSSLLSALGLDLIPGNILAGRLSGVFNYPNTYAAFCLALTMASFLFYISGHSVLNKVAPALLPLFILSLLLAWSRGTFLISPVPLIIIYLLLPASQRSGAWLTFMLLLLPGLVAYPFFMLAFQQANLASGVLILVLAITSTYYLAGRLQKKPAWLQAISGKAGVVFCLVVLAGLVFAWFQDALPPISGMVSMLNNQSFYERISFNLDGWKIFQDYPWLGTGLGGWKVMYPSYQSFPYTSNQVHNFYLQLLLETGLVGFSLFLALPAYIFYLFYNRRLPHDKSGPGLFFLAIVATFLLHGLVDFDFSYGYINLLFFVSLAGLSITCFPPTNASVPLPLAEQFRPGFIPGRKIPLALMGLLLLSGLFINSRYVIGMRYYDQALLQIQQHDYPAALVSLQAALGFFPVHQGYKKTTASLQEAIARKTGNRELLAASLGMYEEIIAAEPYDVNAYSSLLKYHLQERQHEQVLQVASQAIALAPFRQAPYELLFQSAAVLAGKGQLAGNTRQLSLHYYKQLRHLIAGQEHLPAGLYLSYRLSLSPRIKQNMAVIAAGRQQPTSPAGAPLP